MNLSEHQLAFRLTANILIKGAMFLEEENAIDSIENLQYHDNQHLGKKATEVADLYYEAVTSCLS